MAKSLTLEAARLMLEAALAHAREQAYKPMAVAVLDNRGSLRAFAAEDGTSLLRGEVALGKAFGAVALGVSSRQIHEMALERPHFVSAVNTLAHGNLVPVPGGVLIRSDGDDIVGAVGISGDTSDHDEAAAQHGIAAAGFRPDPA